jgi:hypothetical protein
MKPEIAQLAVRFMERVQLQGQEVPAFNVVMQALAETAQAPAADAQTSSQEIPVDGRACLRGGGLAGDGAGPDRA